MIDFKYVACDTDEFGDSVAYSAALPENEKDRLLSLRDLMVLDSEPENLFDDITRIAKKICGTSIALISLVDESRQWFKSNIGLEGVTETSRELAFCAHTILEQKVMEVPDATKDPRFNNNPLVTGEPNIRFYAGAPIVLPTNHVIGTLCVIDHSPHTLSSEQKNLLEDLAKTISTMLLARQSAIHRMQNEANNLVAIVESSQDAIISKSLDVKITSWNRGAEKIFGYSSQEVLGKHITFIFPKDKLDEEEFLIGCIMQNKIVEHFETERINKLGELIQVSVTLSPIRDTFGNVIGISKIARDISSNKLLQAALAEEHERLKVTMDSIGDAVITTDKKGKIEYLNPIAEKLTGWPLSEARDKPLEQAFIIINEFTRGPVENPVEHCLKEGRIVGLANHTRLISRDGSEYGIEDSAAPIRDSKGNTIGAVLVFHDVTVQREMANEMTYRATHDPLTGLINRVELEHSLEKALISAREHDIEHALMYIDLDQFKVVNDNCGHSAGDKLLTEITKVIRKCIRVTDTLARIGGDEFVVLLEECDKEPAMRLAQQVCDSVDQYRFHHDNQRFRIGASIGLVIVDSHWSSIATLLQAADSACYAAKEAGRNRVHLYFDSDYAMETRLGETKWVSRIEQAIEEQRFLLYCQRIFPLNGESKEHGEVLIRMQDDEGGLIAPSSFLPAAERFHIMTRIDRWVVATVFSWLKEHDGELDYIETLSINLSGQSLGDNTFHAYVLELIEVLAVDCTMLTFEITETVAINNFNEANKFIASMKKYGARFSLDDFGSGVSSFGYLKNLPVDYLKIDGQFIRHLTENQIDQATVRCIVEVAKCTQKKTIAEWVESEEVQTLLKQLGVDYCQGFYRHIPAPIDNLLEVKCTFVN